MRTGFAVWQVLEAAGLEVVETFPAACFHRLNGGRWPPRKTTPAGRADRLCLLAAFIDLPPDAGMWGHDAIDAVVCALVAQRGRPAGHECDRPDGSVMWLLDDVVGARTEDRQAVQDR
jgi:predicted nuclease with RNAse H fold